VHGHGLPVLHGVAGESAEIVRETGVGLVFEPENAAELVDQLYRLRRDPALYEQCRRQGLEAARSYDRTALALKMLAVLDEACG
jgi:glycosyltransferase involved in cell wall biosynthesis